MIATKHFRGTIPLRQRPLCQRGARRSRWRLPLLIASLLALVSSTVVAGDVRRAISAGETYVGLPITLQVQFQDVEQHVRPEIPAVDGLTIRAAGAPSRRSQVTIINGQRTERESLTYRFEITPQRVGTFQVPPFTVAYDQRRELLPGFDLVARESEAGDLLEASIAGQVDALYVGEALELQLNILIRPYRNEQHQLTLSEGQMWRLLSERTEWGIFADRMEQLAQQNQRPAGRDVTRDNAEGKPQR